jgi:hypothetical protein
LNTGILLLLVQANFGEILKDVDTDGTGGIDSNNIINKIFNGPFYDFVPLWYTVVGYKII